MTLSRLEHSLLLAQRDPFLKPEGTEGGGNGGESSGDNANAGGEQAGSEGTQGDSKEGEGFKPITSEAELAAWKEGVRKNMLAEARKAAKDEAKREADAAAAKEKGEWEQVAKGAEEERDQLKAELAKRDHDDLKRRVAAKHELPAELADRLIGDDETALDEDAKKLAKTVGARKAPDTEGGAGEKGASGPSDRPIRKTAKEGEKQPAYTFDGKQKVAWGTRG